MQIGQGFGVGSGFSRVQELFGNLTPEMEIVRTSAPLPSELLPGQPVVASTIRKISTGTIFCQSMSNPGRGDGMHKSCFPRQVLADSFPVRQRLNDVLGWMDNDDFGSLMFRGSFPRRASSVLIEALPVGEAVGLEL